MVILLVCIIKLIFTSFVSAQTDPIPRVMCAYAASAQQEKVFEFSLSDVPERCDAIQLGVYFLDYPSFLPDDNTTIQQIASVIEDGKKSLWIIVAFQTTNLFSSIIDSNGTISAYHSMVEPMLDCLQQNNINGIILDYSSIFNETISDFGTKMSEFICKMKECIPTLKVALGIPGWFYESFSDTEIIDFSQTNDAIDMYIINVMNAGVPCDKNGLETGLLPIESTNSNVSTLDVICEAVKNSAMDQSKLSILFLVGVQLQAGSSMNSTTYSTYCQKCSTNDIDPSDLYCPDSVERFYDQAKYASDYFKGMALLSLDMDDFDNSCSCEPFPIANAYIDGFENEDIKCCDSLA